MQLLLLRRRSVRALAMTSALLMIVASTAYARLGDPKDVSRDGHSMYIRGGLYYLDPNWFSAYGDHYGTPAGGGTFDHMYINTAQFDKNNCGAWNFRNQAQGNRYNVTQNWSQTAYVVQPAGNCIKRRSQPEGQIWKGSSYYIDYTAWDE